MGPWGVPWSSMDFGHPWILPEAANEKPTMLCFRRLGPNVAELRLADFDRLSHLAKGLTETRNLCVCYPPSSAHICMTTPTLDSSPEVSSQEDFNLFISE